MAVLALLVIGGCSTTVPEAEDAGSVVPSLVPVVQIGCDDCDVVDHGAGFRQRFPDSSNTSTTGG